MRQLEASRACRTADPQQQVLDCSDLLSKLAATLVETAQPDAAALFLVSKSWEQALKALPETWRSLIWEQATRRARYSDAVVPSLCLSLSRWWGSKLTEFNAGGGCPIASLLLIDECLALVARCSPNLQVVRLCGCTHITDWGLQQLAACAPPLRSFSLQWCGAGVYLQGLRAVIRACPALESFSVSSGQESVSLGSVTDELVAELAASCPRIAALELSDTRVRDAGLADIATAYGPRLRSLRINYTRAWGQWGALALAQRCRSLRAFSAASSAATDDTLSLLGGGCQQLALVCVNRCPRVSLDGIMRLVNRGPSLQCVQMAGIYRRATAEQRGAFDAWVQRRGMRFDARSGLLAAPQASSGSV